MRATILIVSIVLIVIIALGLQYQSPCWTLTPRQENIVIGVFSSLLIVVLIEGLAWIRDFRNYNYLKGTFKRVEIHNKLDQRKGDKIYEDITSRYINKQISSEIKIRSLGEGGFSGTADYEEGKVKFDIFLDKVNPSYGTGTYEYISKKEGYRLPDVGKFETIRDKVNADRIFVYYKNVVPSGLTEGYEIWEKS